MPVRHDIYLVDTAKAHVIDQIFEDEEENFHGLWSKLTIECLHKENPNAKIMTVEQFYDFQYERFATKSEQVTEARYWEMLEILPPLDMHVSGQNTSFKMSERLTGNLTSIFAQIGDTYWTFVDRDTMTHEEIIAKILKEQF